MVSVPIYASSLQPASRSGTRRGCNRQHETHLKPLRDNFSVTRDKDAFEYGKLLLHRRRAAASSAAAAVMTRDGACVCACVRAFTV